MLHCAEDRNAIEQRKRPDARYASALAETTDFGEPRTCDNVTTDRTGPKEPHFRKTIHPCPMWKRTIDVAGACVLLVLLAPGLLTLAVFIKCVSKGPVLYRQRRYGLRGRVFRVWKFRTIEVGEDRNQHRSHVTGLMANDATLKKRDEELKIIVGGRLLRALGVDELPQLFNVLRGEMSLVGPRPDVVPYYQYSAVHQRRFDVVPGITGLWQVRGKNRTTFRQMMRLDLAYVRNRSPRLDFMILISTFPALVAEVISPSEE